MRFASLRHPFYRVQRDFLSRVLATSGSFTVVLLLALLALGSNMSASIAVPKRKNFVRRLFCVVSEWFRNPSQVATICPSSPFLTRHLADRECVRDADRIVELGPGTGGTTRALLSQMKPGSRLLSIEKTEAFADVLKEICDSRLHVELADACDLIEVVNQHRFSKADVVLSGIPFSALPSENAARIVQSIYDVLNPGGTFIAYQLRSDILDYVEPIFGAAKTESVAVNLPPLQIFVWTKTLAPDCHSSTGARQFADSGNQGFSAEAH